MPNAGPHADSGWLRVPLFLVFLFVSSALLVRSYVEVRLRERGFGLAYASDLSYLVVPPFLFMLMYPVLRKHGYLLSRLYAFRQLSLRVVAVGILLGVALRCAFWGRVVAMTSFGISFSGDSPGIVGPYLAWQCPPVLQLALGLLVTAMFIPLIEEAVNRGLFLHGLLHRGPLIAVLVSSALFAVFHNLQTIYVAFIIGLFFAVATLNSGALWISTFAHATYNFSALIDWRCLNGQWNPQEVTPVLAGLGALGTGLLLVSLLLCGLLVSKRLIGTPDGAR